MSKRFKPNANSNSSMGEEVQSFPPIVFHRRREAVPIYINDPSITTICIFVGRNSGRDIVCYKGNHRRSQCAHCTDFIRVHRRKNNAFGVFSMQMDTQFGAFFETPEADADQQEGKQIPQLYGKHGVFRRNLEQTLSIKNPIVSAAFWKMTLQPNGEIHIDDRYSHSSSDICDATYSELRLASVLAQEEAKLTLAKIEMDTKQPNFTNVDQILEHIHQANVTVNHAKNAMEHAKSFLDWGMS